MQGRSYREEREAEQLREARRRSAITLLLVFVAAVVVAAFAFGLVHSLRSAGGSLLTPCPGSTPTALEAGGGRAVIRCANGSAVESHSASP